MIHKVKVEEEILSMLSEIIEKKDAYTADHSKRVAFYSCQIAQVLGLGEEEQLILYQSGLLHDVGKILTPEATLLKPRKFNRQEYEIIKRHSEDGEEIVGAISSFSLHAKIIRHHHERYDGNGYPDGLSGENIPLFSRIMSIADAFDAMTTNRIYKVRKTIPKAIEEIKLCAGTQFDPLLVKKAIDVFVNSRELIHAAQSPEHQTIHEERFAFFFKDGLTGFYNPEYLDHFLQKNKEAKRFRRCYFIQLHRMHSYNQRFGWKLGNALIKEVALRIKVLFASSFIFRVFGDDFIVLNPLHVAVEEKEVLNKLSIGFKPIKVSLQHFDIEKNAIQSWEQLENHLIHHED